MTPALSHFWISRRTLLSAIRCSRNFTNHDWSRPVKKSLMSASSTKFTFLRGIPVASASNGSCCERPGRNPYEKPKKSCHVYGVQHLDHRPLKDLILKRRCDARSHADERTRR